MVATRRAAHPAVEDELAMDDPELALKKKPVRTAATKATKTATKAAEKPKATRGKKAGPTPEIQEDEVEDVQPAKPTRKAAGRPRKEAGPEPPVGEGTMSKKPTRATKAGSVRGKKAAVVAEDVEPAPVAEEAKPTRASKAGSVRGKKAAVAVDAEPAPPANEPKTTKGTKAGSVRGRKAAAAVIEAPGLPPPEEPIPTRSTRTTAAKAPPLSPKKITQVSKPATRTTRNASQKPAAKAAPVKPASKGRGGARKRTESNENVDPDEDEDVEMVSTMPIKPKSTRGKAKKEEAIVESEASMSSRPTTPNDSAATSFNRNDDDMDELQQDDDADPAVPQTLDAASENSDDELCGPKTPMKRSSPGAAGRYRESVQRTIRKYEANIHMETPARRFAVLGSQRGTPQTQKPYCKPAPPNSDVRPMTVSRGADRAFVFQDLRTGTPTIGQFEDLEEGQDELSFIPDDDIIPMDTEDSAEQTPTPADSFQSNVEIESDIDMEDEVHFAANSAFEEDEEAFIAPSLVEPDPEETVLIHDVDEGIASPVTDPVESFETEDTVLIQRSFIENRNNEMLDDDDDASDSDSGSVIHVEKATTEGFVETVSPIAVNFDEHLANARPSPQKLQYEDVAATTIAVEYEEDATIWAAMEVDFDGVIQEQSSHRQTVDLNDYIDMSALSEPTIALENLPNEVDTVQAGDTELDHEMPATETPLLDEAPPTGDADDAEQVIAGAEEVLPEVDLNFTQAEPEEADVIDRSTTMDQDVHEVHQAHEAAVPHYALPTIAFDARRKSLPVLSFQTPVNVGARPNTSDGASMPRIVNPFTNAWWTKQSRQSTAATTVKSRPSTAHGIISQSNVGTPAKVSKATTPVATPGERFPRFAPRSDYEEHAKTAVPPVRFQTPTKVSPKRRETFHKAIPGQVNTRPVGAPSSPVRNTPVRTPVATPQVTPGERYPRLRPRQDYDEHAKTVAAPVRFKTPPAKTPLKRPATTQKTESLRIAALKATGSHTPIKTSLKAPAMTPGQVPMTPHPAAPLSGVVAMVEVYTLEGASASTPFVALLHRLGAKTARSMSDKVTHVIFKDGSPTTLQRVRLNNKEVEGTGKGTYIHCVNSRWVTDCDAEGVRKDEAEEEYAVDVAEVPRGGKRRRKSMEPSALMNIGGNIVRDRKTSLGRASIGRSSYSPAKRPQPELVETPKIDAAEKENSGDDQSSPATPAWIAAPSQLVQQTAPMNRIRKLELQGGKSPKNRRLTFWNGGA